MAWWFYVLRATGKSKDKHTDPLFSAYDVGFLQAETFNYF
jgi:hypothetical protein